MLDNNSQQPKAFDSKTIIAILVIGVFYLGWNQYLAKKYPEMNKKKEAQTTAAQTTPEGTSQTAPAQNAVTAPTAGPTGETTTSTADLKMNTKPAQLVTYQDDKVSFQVSSSGMAIGQFITKAYSDRKNNPINLTPVDPGLFQLTWGTQQQPVSFDVQKVGENQFKGTATVDSVSFERTLTYDPKTYSFSQEIKVSNPQNVNGQFSLVSQDIIHVPESTSWLFPSYEHQDFLTFVGEHKETFNINRAKENVDKSVAAVSLYSLGSQYFTVGFLDNSEVKSDLHMKTDLASKRVVHALNYKLPQAAEFIFKQQLFVGPKSSESLAAANPSFVNLLDYGMLGWISKPLLATMKWFHNLVGNWGVAIILLTLLVRALVLPFNLMSFRSMKGMQKIQPILADLRERYKNDPVTLNREMMATMKNNNANPLAGCLPILLQIPIFFALYRVIGSSVELYQAPFFGWIQDLSLHDKFYVLPVLMGITMFIQQKLTPSTMDPMQAKILTFMPVVFSLFMLNLPAGLTLYMVISAVFGITQQKTFLTLMKS